MEYAKKFFKNEDGMETLEFLVIMAVVVGVIALAVTVGKDAKGAGEKAKGTAATGLKQLQNNL